MLFQPFWPQTDPSTQKSYTTDWTYLRFFKLKLSGYPQFRKYQNKLFKCSQFKKYQNCQRLQFDKLKLP